MKLLALACLLLAGCTCMTKSRRHQIDAHLVAAQAQLQRIPDYAVCLDGEPTSVVGRICIAWDELAAGREALEQ